MQTVTIHDAKTHLSRLVEQAANGEPFVIAKAGRPMVKVVAIEDTATPRLGFMKGEFSVPDDFKEISRLEIEEMFYGKA